MTFSFLRLLTPTWYYNLSPDRGRRYWADVDMIPSDDNALIDRPQCYSSRNAEALDMSYQAWLKGIMVDEYKALEAPNEAIPVPDEYKFLRRHFAPIWVFFTLLLRIASLNNPFREVFGYISSRSEPRIDAFRRTKDWRPELAEFRSALLSEGPKVSVIIPTLNRYKYLADALADLEGQDYKNFEVLIVDQSEPFQRDFYRSYELDLKVWHQKERALWLARNIAIERSEAELILLFDDDSRVGPDWIRSHIRCLDYFQADISSGASISVVGAKVPETYSYYKWGDQIDTGNVMLKKDIFRKIGLFDRQFEKQRQGDAEFGLRAYLAGFTNVSNPDAVRTHLKVAEGGLRDMGTWDGWRPKSFFSPRPVPSVLYLTRKYFGNRAALYQILQSIFPSIVPYRFKRNRSVMVAGSAIGLLLFPLICVSVLRSWRLATEKLREGPKIARLV